MGELPPFITNVPEESLKRQKTNIDISRTFKFLHEAYDGTGILEDVYRVPKGFVFEITSIQISVKEPTASSDARHEVYVGEDGKPRTETLTSEVYVGSMNSNNHYNFGRGILFVEEEKLIRWKASGSANARFVIIIIGFLLKKEDFRRIYNIIL